MLARVAVNKPRRSHSAELLQSLHWLPVKERIDFKVQALLTYKVRNSSTPDYLKFLPTNRVINSVTLRSSSKQVLNVPRSRTVRRERAFSIAALTMCGTNFLLMFKWRTVLPVLNRVSKHLYFELFTTVRPQGKRLCIL
jgi:hypothetical protein